MTMTNDELNRWIAEKKGFSGNFIYDTFIYDTFIYDTFIYDTFGFIEDYEPTPDYCTNWKLAGELLEEANITLIPVEGGNEERVGWIATAEYPVIFSTFKNGLWYEASTEHFCFADTPQRAIAEAWKAWKENE